ncbi:MAG: hypothetical protein WC322_06935 [Candidatus Paceibacterota bacterium]|jgi:hypothetical protein
MPYSVHKSGDRWKVVKDSDGKVMGTHKTKAEARKQIYAITMGEKRKG